MSTFESWSIGKPCGTGIGDDVVAPEVSSHSTGSPLGTATHFELEPEPPSTAISIDRGH
jgi:hypothetical protein